MKNLMVFGCSGTIELATKICEELKVELGRLESFKFSNDNRFVKVLDTVREKDIFLIQSSYEPVDENLMELLITIDALRRASAGRINVVTPYFPYSRSDKKDQPRVAITARLVADLMQTAGANRIIACDLHAPQIQGFFTVPLDHLTAMPLLYNYFKEKEHDNYVVVATDAGGAKNARKFANWLDVTIALFDKRRIGNEECVCMDHIIGAVRGKRAILLDDEVDSAGTVKEAVDALVREGATEVYVACTHAILSGPAIDRIKHPAIKEFITTDTIPVVKEKRLEKMIILPTAAMFAEAIKRIHLGESIGEMFGEEEGA